MIFCIPLLPFLPLVAAHPAGHQRDAQLVGRLDEVFAGDFPSSRSMFRPRSFAYCRIAVFAVRVVLEEQVGRVGGAAHQEVLAVDLQIEVAAVAGETGRRDPG